MMKHGRNQEFGRRVDRILGYLDWSSADCAREMRQHLPDDVDDVTPQAVWKWRNGAGISDPYLEALAAAIEVDPQELYYGPKNNSQGGRKVERLGPYILTPERVYRVEELARLKESD